MGGEKKVYELKNYIRVDLAPALNFRRNGSGFNIMVLERC